MRENNKTVFVAMSGGVDSSVAAALLKKQGFDVVGVFMKCWSNNPNCLSADIEDAQKVANVLKIPFYVFDFEKEYKNKVVDYMVDGYRQGITPNPDVMCNKEIKFGMFLDKALSMGADYMATGHYVKLIQQKNFISSTRFATSSDSARLSSPSCPALSEKRLGPCRDGCEVSDNKVFLLNHTEDQNIITPWHLSKRSSRRHGELGLGALVKSRRAESADGRRPLESANHRFSQEDATGLYSLFQAKDQNKDQSYFLWTLTQNQLKHCLFPIGNYTKPQVRTMAKKFNLPNAEKKDSQGICFLGKVNLNDFLNNYLLEKKGAVLTAAGEKIGEHKGAHFFTIGQRHGFHYETWNLKHETLNKKDREPFYIAEKDIKTNTLIVAEGNDNPALYKNEIELGNVNFINPTYFSNSCEWFQMKVLARVRYRQPLAKACFIFHASCFKLVFDEPQKFVASGQSTVFYRKDGEMLGGGIIKSCNPQLETCNPRIKDKKNLSYRL